MYKKRLAGLILIVVLVYLCKTADWSYWLPYWFDKVINLIVTVLGGTIAGCLVIYLTNIFGLKAAMVGSLISLKDRIF